MLIEREQDDVNRERAATTSWCPDCGGVMAPIAYGLPGPEMFDAARRGEIVLGGCCPDFTAQFRCTTCATACGEISVIAPDLDKRLHRLLTRDLGAAVDRNARGTWTTTSSVPHEIRLQIESGIPLVQVSAGVLVDVQASYDLLAAVNELNTTRSLIRYLVEAHEVEAHKVRVVSEMRLASVRAGDLEALVSDVLCCARSDVSFLAQHGGRAVASQPPAQREPDFGATLHTWQDVLRASGTATAAELAHFLDDLVGCECWLDVEDWCVTVFSGSVGIESRYPFTLEDLGRRGREVEHVDVLEARLLTRFPLPGGARVGLSQKEASSVFSDFGYPPGTAAEWARDGWLQVDERGGYFLSHQGMGWIRDYLPPGETWLRINDL